MEKKTRFKLKFIKAHLTKAQAPHCHKLRRSKKHLFLRKETAKPLVLYKYFNPIFAHRIVGDLVFLDHISNSEDFIPLSTLWNPFKFISDIVITDNFTICTKLDVGYYMPNTSFLIDRLLSLGELKCYNLALTIAKFSKNFSSLPLKKEEHHHEYQKDKEHKENKDKQLLKASQNSKDFEEYLQLNSKEPSIIYYYIRHSEMGIVNSKISVNKELKDLTFQDDILIFEESLFVVPSNEYFSYMIEHLERCFDHKNELLTMYINTNQGVKKAFGKSAIFTINDEQIVVITFPKEAQSSELQKMYEGKNEKTVAKIEKKTKKPAVIKSFWEWESLIKSYYDPNDGKQEKSRCQYRIIKQKNYPFYPLTFQNQ